MLTNLAVQLLLFKTRTFAELELELEHEHELELALELELEHELELAVNRACYIGGGLIKIPKCSLTKTVLIWIRKRTD